MPRQPDHHMVVCLPSPDSSEHWCDATMHLMEGHGGQFTKTRVVVEVKEEGTLVTLPPMAPGLKKLVMEQHRLCGVGDWGEDECIEAVVVTRHFVGEPPDNMVQEKTHTIQFEREGGHARRIKETVVHEWVETACLSQSVHVVLQMWTALLPVQRQHLYGTVAYGFQPLATVVVKDGRFT